MTVNFLDVLIYSARILWGLGYIILLTKSVFSSKEIHKIFKERFNGGPMASDVITSIVITLWPFSYIVYCLIKLYKRV